MKETFHVIYIIIVMFLMTWFFLLGNVCGVCFTGFLLINARLNERKEEGD